MSPGPTTPATPVPGTTAHDRTWKIYYALSPPVLKGTIWNQIIPPGHSAGLTTGDQFLTDRIAASGPGGSQGWVTVDAGVNPNTAP